MWQWASYYYNDENCIFSSCTSPSEEQLEVRIRQLLGHISGPQEPPGNWANNPLLAILKTPIYLKQSRIGMLAETQEQVFNWIKAAY